MKNNFLIFGAGAIGTYIGASLGLRGHQVVYLEKDNAITTLRQRGLHMVMGAEEYQLSTAEFFSGYEIIKQRHFDLAILALKTFHLERILPELIALKEHLPPLLSLQNGVESEKKLAKALGASTLIPGTVTSAVDRLDKGRVLIQKTRGMGIAGEHPRIKDFQVAFNHAGLNCRYYRRPEPMKWSKLITNLLGNASSAILNLPPTAIFSHPGLYKMELEQIRECLNVMNRQHIPVVNLPGVPVKLLAGVVRSLPASLSQPILSRRISGGRGKKMPSFHIDLHSGRGKSEVEELNGAVVSTGKDLGVVTPVNEFLTTRLMALTNGELSINEYQNRPDVFLEDLDTFKAEQSITG